MRAIEVEVYRRSDNLSVTYSSMLSASKDLGVNIQTVANRMKDGYAIVVNGYPLHCRKASNTER